MLKLYRDNNGKFITAYAYRQEANAGKLAFGIMLLFGIILSLVDAVI